MSIDIGQYEVLRGEDFAHMTEPMVSFARRAVWINMGCLKRMPSTVYVHFLLSKGMHSLIIKPSVEEERDVVRWCTPSGKPRKIMCDIDFWNDLTAHMGWNERNRYRVLGRFVHGLDWDGFAFDMTRVEVFPIEAIDSASTPLVGEAAAGRGSLLCQTWEEHCKNPLVSRFEKDTLIEIDEVE